MDKTSRSIRRAAFLIALGLAVEVLAFLYWTPMTFIVFASIGLPLVAGGVGWYLLAVLAFLRERRAL
ncbi:MAG: hypothetical protein AAFX94_04385 [Myxococcota bacterium]